MAVAAIVKSLLQLMRTSGKKEEMHTYDGRYPHTENPVMIFLFFLLSDQHLRLSPFSHMQK
jgi:hypothetical protein